MEQGCLVRDCQFVLPATMHSQILGLTHMGHPGITHMLCKVHEAYWCPGLNTEVHDLVNQCIGCQFSEKTTPLQMFQKSRFRNRLALGRRLG